MPGIRERSTAERVALTVAFAPPDDGLDDEAIRFRLTTNTFTASST